jgi:molybdopterin/thiamine biosynthesis adenylyltransferase
MMRRVENSESRYQRQASLLQNEGWDQEKIKKAKIVVIGNNVLANYAALTLSAFGFGDIELYMRGKIDQEIARNHSENRSFDYSKGFLFFESNEEDAKATSLEKIINEINPEIKFRGINLGMQRAENCAVLRKPDLIIDATNNPASKISVIEYSISKNIPVVSMSAGKYGGGVGIFNPREDRNKTDLIENLFFNELKEESQDPIISQVISGIGIEETRKIINPMKNEQVLEDIIIYNLLSNRRFDHSLDREIGNFTDLRKYSICLVGAGALGNFVGLGLALRNIGNLTIVDYDVTELTNLNRQILLYDAVDVEKSIGLVKNLKKINPRVNYNAKVEKILPSSEKLFSKGNFDLIIDTVDNNKTRALLNYFSTKYHIPFISGGTRYNSGQVNICVPEKSGCLNCQANIDELAMQASRRQSCIYTAQPSVITSNQITAGLIVGEVPFVLDETMGSFARGELKFVSNEEYRLSLLPSAAEECSCHENKNLIDTWYTKMTGVYEK